MPWKERTRIKIGTRKLTSKSEAASILDVRNPAAEGEFHPGAGVRAAFSTIRKTVQFMSRDRAMDRDVQRMCELVASGVLLTAS